MHSRCVRPVPPHATSHAFVSCRQARRQALGRSVVEVVDDVLAEVVVLVVVGSRVVVVVLDVLVVVVG